MFALDGNNIKKVERIKSETTALELEITIETWCLKVFRPNFEGYPLELLFFISTFVCDHIFYRCFLTRQVQGNIISIVLIFNKLHNLYSVMLPCPDTI